MREEQQQIKTIDIFDQTPNPYIMKFLNAAYNRKSSDQVYQKATQPLLSRHYSDTTLANNNLNTVQRVNVEQTQLKKHIYKRKIPVHSQNHQALNFIACGALIMLFIFIIVDLKYQYENRVHMNKISIKKCHEKFIQNRCLQPLQALVQRCNQLQLCMERDPQNQVKYSQVMAYCLASLFNTLFKTIGIVGFIAIVALILVYMHRPRHHIEQQIHKFL